MMTEVRDQDFESRDNATIVVADIVQDLAELGLIPYEICTGIGPQSVLCNSLWKPRFGIATNSEKDAHHIFTLAAMAGWNAEYDINGRGVLVKRFLQDMDETLGAWALLLNAARLVMGEINRL